MIVNAISAQQSLMQVPITKKNQSQNVSFGLLSSAKSQGAASALCAAGFLWLANQDVGFLKVISILPLFAAVIFGGLAYSNRNVQNINK